MHLPHHDETNRQQVATEHTTQQGRLNMVYTFGETAGLESCKALILTLKPTRINISAMPITNSCHLKSCICKEQDHPC